MFSCCIASGCWFRADPELVKFLLQMESGTEDEVFHPCPQAFSWWALLGFCLFAFTAVKWIGDVCCLCKKGKISKQGVLYDSMRQLQVWSEWACHQNPLLLSSVHWGSASASLPVKWNCYWIAQEWRKNLWCIPCVFEEAYINKMYINDSSLDFLMCILSSAFS